MITARENLLMSIEKAGIFNGYRLIPGRSAPRRLSPCKKRFGHDNYASYFKNPLRYADIPMRKTWTDAKKLFLREQLPEKTDIDYWGVGHSHQENCFHMTRMHHPMTGDASLDEVGNYPLPAIENDAVDRLKAQVKEITPDQKKHLNKINILLAFSPNREFINFVLLMMFLKNMSSPKRILIILVLSIFSLVNYSCVTKSPGYDNRTITDFIKHFDANGLKAEKIYPSLCEIIKAETGCVLIVENNRFEIYKYNLKDPIQKKKYDKIKDDEEIFILGFKHPVKINGSFVLINYKGHPKEPEIIEVFEKFQQPD